MQRGDVIYSATWFTTDPGPCNIRSPRPHPGLHNGAFSPQMVWELPRNHSAPPLWTSSPTTTPGLCVKSLVMSYCPLPGPCPGPAGTPTICTKSPPPCFHSWTAAPRGVGANVPGVMSQEDPGAWAAAERDRECAEPRSHSEGRGEKQGRGKLVGNPDELVGRQETCTLSQLCHQLQTCSGG